MGSGLYGPKGDELETTLADVLRHSELSEAVGKATRLRQTSQGGSMGLIAELFNAHGSVLDDIRALNFETIVQMEVFRRDRDKGQGGVGMAVITALRWYAFGTIDEKVTKHLGYAVVTEPLIDYLAISTKTKVGSPIREVAVSLLDTLAGEAAVEAATTTVNGEGIK